MAAWVIKGCVCGVTVMDDGWHRVDWFTNQPHDCKEGMLSTLQMLTGEALSGDDLSARLVPDAVDVWLRERS